MPSLHRWLAKRCEDFGNRLSKATEFPGLHFLTGQVQWSKACYTAVWDYTKGTDQCVEFVHSSGDIASAAGTFYKKGLCHFENNWNDMGAVICQPPLKPLPVCTFFEEAGTGPFRYKAPTKNGKDLQKTVQACSDTLEEEKKKASASSTSPQSKLATEKLEQINTAKMQKRCEKAREQARAVLLERKNTKKIKIS